MEESPESDLEGQFGFGPFPQELDRINWGALFFGWLWAIWHGSRSWFAFLFLAGLFGSLVVTFIRVGVLGHTLLGQFAITAISVAANWTVLVVFALRANRLLWERQGRRIQTGVLHPYKTRPVANYEESQRVWAWAGIALLLLGYVLTWVRAATSVTGSISPGSLRSTMFATACDLLALGRIWIYERHRRAKLTSASRRTRSGLAHTGGG